MASSISVKGLSELGASLQALADDVALRVCARATFKGARFIKDLAITRAPAWPVAHKLKDVEVPPGNLKKQIIVKKVAKNKTYLTAEYLVTVRGKKKDFYAARYGRLVEFGTVKMSARPYLRPAFDGGKEAAVGIIKDELNDGIDRAARKAAKA